MIPVLLLVIGIWYYCSILFTIFFFEETGEFLFDSDAFIAIVLFRWVLFLPSILFIFGRLLSEDAWQSIKAKYSSDKTPQ